jgi:presenilin-like A22 family membrane protease
MYAVWHTGFMQKMAKYQIKTLRVFSGFFVPYMSRQQKSQVKNMKKSDLKKVKVNVAILGGGDVIFPILLAGTVLRQFSFAYALLISLGATLSLVYLFYTGEKGKAYPAMPYITVGSFIGLALVYLINYL